MGAKKGGGVFLGLSRGWNPRKIFQQNGSKKKNKRSKAGNPRKILLNLKAGKIQIGR